MWDQTGTGTNYAPTMIARHTTARGCKRTELEAAQQRLIDTNKIHVKTVGPPSKQRKYIFAGPRHEDEWVGRN
jgi:hypothetical protein